MEGGSCSHERCRRLPFSSSFSPFSCVAVCQHDKVEIIANDQGKRTTPSFVAFTNTEHLIGDPAKSQASLNPQNTVFDAKRLIGRKYEDATVQEDMKHWPFTVVSHEEKLKVQVSHKEDGIFEVKATAGDTHLGGEDFDKRLVAHLAEEFKKKHRRDLYQDKKALQRLKTAAEHVKCTLSSCTSASISVDSLFQGTDFHMTITRARFEDLCSDLFRATLRPLERALKDAKMSKGDIKDIVLVGGSTRIPKIQKLLKEFFSGKELNKGINPDEAVAYGAAIQAAVLTGNRTPKMQNMFLLDVTPLSLGINTQGGVMATVIKRNSPVPTKEVMEFTTTEDDQDTILFMVYEGERALTKHNHLLGMFTLKGIPPAPCGVPVILVTFSIDENNILTVSAKDVETGNTNHLTISDTRGHLGKEEIETIVQKAEEFRANDMSQQEKIEAMNSLESCSLELKRVAEEQLLDVKAKRRMLEMCDCATSWLEGNPLARKEECEQRQKDLEEAWDSIYTSLGQSEPPEERAEGDPEAAEPKEKME